MPEPNDIFAVKVISTGKLNSTGDAKLYNNGYTLSSGTTFEHIQSKNTQLDGAAGQLLVGDYILLKDQAGNDTTAHKENGLWQVAQLGDAPTMKPWILNRVTPGGNLKLNELFYGVCGDSHSGEVWRLAEIDNSPSTTADGITAGATKLKFVEGPLVATKLQGDVCSEGTGACKAGAKILENGDSFDMNDAQSWFRGDVLSLGPDCETEGAPVVDVGKTPDDSVVCAGKIKGGTLVGGQQKEEYTDTVFTHDQDPLTSDVLLVDGSPVPLPGNANVFNLQTAENNVCEGQLLHIRNNTQVKVDLVDVDDTNNVVLTLAPNNGASLMYQDGKWHDVSSFATELVGNVLAEDCTKVLENGTNGTDAWLRGNVQAENGDNLLTSGADRANSNLHVQDVTANGNTILGNANTDDLTVNAKLQAPGIAGETTGNASWLGLIMDSFDDGITTISSTSTTSGSGQAVPSNTYISRLESTDQAGTDVYFDLADGEIAGQLKVLRFETKNTDNIIIEGTLANSLINIAMDTTGEEVLLMWNGSAWRVIRNTSATLNM